MTEQSTRTNFALIAAMVVASLLFVPFLPAEMPIHWNIRGEVDGTASKWVAVSLFPLLAIGIFALFRVLPRLDPRREHYEKFLPTYRRLERGILLFIGLIHLMMLTAYDQPQLLTRGVLLAVAVLLGVIGNELSRVQPTWFVGIRTPWTLADDRVWRQTHRVGARAFVVVAIIGAIGALVLPLEAAFFVFMGTLLPMVFGLFVYSYVLYQRWNS